MEVPFYQPNYLILQSNSLSFAFISREQSEPAVLFPKRKGATTRNWAIAAETR